MTIWFALMWLISINALAFIILKSRPMIIKSIIITISLILVLYKTTEYTLQIASGNLSKIPVEFSAVTYILFGLTFLFSIRVLKPFVTFAAFLSGFGYLIVFPFISEFLVSVNGFQTKLVALISHSLLYLGSLLVMKLELLPASTRKLIMIWTLLVVIYQIGMGFIIQFENEFLFIYIVLEGRAIIGLQEALPGIAVIIYLVYFAGIWFIYYLLASLFYLISQKIYYRYSIKELHQIKNTKKYEE
ncbi:MAG: hypothetical protein NUK62_08135 [Tenericutes bacterium]|nr:hypothetical protein [Mycoplasmatota bacterium]